MLLPINDLPTGSPREPRAVAKHATSALLTLVFAFSAALSMSGCGGEAEVKVARPPSGTMSPTAVAETPTPIPETALEGQVSLPVSAVASGLMERFASIVVSRVQALTAPNVEPVGAGVVVRLIRLTAANIVGGEIDGGVEIGTAQTDSQGRFSFSEDDLPSGITPDTCRLLAQVDEGGSLTRAFVASGQVDINFESEATVRLILESIGAGEASLCDFDSFDILDIGAAVEDAPGQIQGTTPADVNAAATTLARIDPGVQEAIAAAVPPVSTPTSPPATATQDTNPTNTQAPPPTETERPTRTPTDTMLPTATPATTATATIAPTNTFTPTNTNTFTPTNTNTFTPTNTFTFTPTQSSSPTNTFTPTGTNTFTPTNSNTPSPTDTFTPTLTPTAVETGTAATETPTKVATLTPTAVPTGSVATMTPTTPVDPTFTPTTPVGPTFTPTSTSTFTPTDTVPPTNTFTNTPTNTFTPTNSNTPTSTNTFTPTNSPAPPTATPTETVAAGLGTETCTLGTGSELLLQLLFSPLPVEPTGSVEIDCGPVDPITGETACSCDIVELDAIPLLGIGDVCVYPAGPCEPGVFACNGGRALDLDLLADHNIGDCSSNADCDAQCDEFCGDLGPNYARQGASCEGFCQGGDSAEMACTQDDQCPGGNCPGKEPAQGGVHDEVCNCTCLGEELGDPGPAGSFSCNLGLQITVERDLDAVCGNSVPSIILPPLCGALSTTDGVGFLAANANNGNNRQRIGPLENSGAPISCDNFETGNLSGLRLQGNLMFFDSTLGDILVKNTFICE